MIGSLRSFFLYFHDKLQGMGVFFHIGKDIERLMIDTYMALAVESGFDQAFRAGGDGLLGLFGHRAAAAGLYSFDNQRLVPRIAEAERHFQMRPFLHLAEIPGGIQPFHRRELGRVPGTGSGSCSLFVIALAADDQDRG